MCTTRTVLSTQDPNPMPLFSERRWEREIFNGTQPDERNTRLVHRDLNAKAGVKFEWMITQDYGKNEVKLTEAQMSEIVAWYQTWKDEDPPPVPLVPDPALVTHLIGSGTKVPPKFPPLTYARTVVCDECDWRQPIETQDFMRLAALVDNELTLHKIGAH